MSTIDVIKELKRIQKQSGYSEFFENVTNGTPAEGQPIGIQLSQRKTLGYKKACEKVSVFAIRMLSPFRAEFTNQGQELLLLFKQFFHNLKKNEILSLSIHSRKLICENALFGIMETIRSNKKELLSEGMFQEGDFERCRLKYLMDKGKEPILFSEGNFEKLLSILSDLIERALHVYFKTSMTGKLNEVGLNDEATRETLMLEYHIECLKSFKGIANAHILSIRNYYLGKSEELSRADKDNYKLFTECPITSYLIRDKAYIPTSIPVFVVKSLAEVCRKLISIRELVSKDNFKIIAENIYYLAAQINEAYSQKKLYVGNTLYELEGNDISGFYKRHYGESELEDIIDVLNSIPKLELLWEQT